MKAQTLPAAIREAAMRHAARDAVIDGDVRLSYAELVDQAETAARQSLQISTAQYQNGAVSYVQLLSAQQTWLQTHTALAQAQAARYADTAALFQALGGGWWNPAAPSEAPGAVVSQQK